jgi:hypothetical protein
VSKEARHHHYLPRCYLRGFRSKNDKPPRIAVLDLKQKKHFETGTRNIGGVRDFNRINVEGLAPDSLENNLSSFEGQVATALRDIGKYKNLDNKTTYAVMMKLIALISVRHPQVRSNWADTEAQIAKLAMGITLATKERYESTLRKIKKDGEEINEDISYEKVKEFFDRGEYDIIVPNESHIDLEFKGVDSVLPFLFNRGWTLVLASQGTGPFVTCDRPVSLTWQYPKKLSPSMKHHPGFGMKETEVLFPITQDMAIIGTFETEHKIISANKPLVASINSKIMAFAISQIYAPDLSFVFLGKNCKLKDGHSILNSWLS